MSTPDDRAERLAAHLRANLKRRKEQARASESPRPEPVSEKPRD